MIVIITSIIMSIYILIAAFVGFNPNLHSIVESDLMRRVENNAYLHSMEYGQLAIRSGNLITPSKQNQCNIITYDLGYIKGVGDSSGSQIVGKDMMNSTISLCNRSGKANLEVEFTYTSK